MRYSPSDTSESFGTCLQGTEVDLLAYENGFYLVKVEETGIVFWTGEANISETYIELSQSK